jgi:hypothetical protein
MSTNAVINSVRMTRLNGSPVFLFPLGNPELSTAFNL